MVISLSVVVLLLILVTICMRGGGLKLSHAILSALLGFFLAGTSLAPTIHNSVAATADVVSGIRP
ncbi:MULTISPECIES: hypothetical protein [unclassified Streptomyces]|uniref:hypothetical protein n=1 Tax=unclassified Streptomyces TaxID=2593676 RepID=UPI00166139CA|nr:MULTISPECIES: hypothetical protein [unclassified Streptomyces]MBD0709025.1 hypothetical protein [Streptomyces sp. CBMA291]MBD0715403.1 hypothetical protein [Streptomyces sp. CBMA370]